MVLRNEIFASIFDWLRVHKDVKDQKDLALKTGIGENTITNILNGKTKVSDHTFSKLNAAFGNIFNPAYLRGSDPFHMLVEDVIHDSLYHRQQKRVHPDVLPEGKDYIPSWADSLIQLVSDNIGATEALRRENASLTSALHEIICENKKLGAQLAAAISEIHTIRRRATITQNYNLASEESIPIAAENM